MGHLLIAAVTLSQVVSLLPTLITLATVIACSPYLLAKARLIRERDEARGWAERLERRVAALTADTEALVALGGEVRAMRDELIVMRRVQVVATRFTVDLILHIRRRGSAAAMPPVPPELSDEVLAELRVRDAHDDAAVLSPHPEVTHP